MATIDECRGVLYDERELQEAIKRGQINQMQHFSASDLFINDNEASHRHSVEANYSISISPKRDRKWLDVTLVIIGTTVIPRYTR